MKVEKNAIQMLVVNMAVWPLILSFFVMFSAQKIFTGSLEKVLLGKGSMSVQEIDGAINAMSSAIHIEWVMFLVFFSCWLVITTLSFPVFTRMVGEKSKQLRLLVVWASLFLVIGIPIGLHYHVETSELMSKVAMLRVTQHVDAHGKAADK